MRRYVKRVVVRNGITQTGELVPVEFWTTRVSPSLADLVLKASVASVKLTHLDGTTVTYSREERDE